MSERCPDCDLPLATSHDFEVTPEGQGMHLCWRSWNDDQCMHPAVDWRSRAIAAERRLQVAEAWLARLDVYIPKDQP